MTERRQQGYSAARSDLYLLVEGLGPLPVLTRPFFFPPLHASRLLISCILNLCEQNEIPGKEAFLPCWKTSLAIRQRV